MEIEMAQRRKWGVTHHESVRAICAKSVPL